MPENPEQVKAITHGDGPMLVIAGPGSGKTFVLTHRIQYLISHYKVRPAQILVITFTKAAASEMKARFGQLVAEDPGMQDALVVQFGTFHAVFFHILKRFYHYQTADILSEKEKLTFIKEIINQKYPDKLPLAEIILQQIGKYRNAGNQISDITLSGIEDDEFIELVKNYTNLCRGRHKLDFNDMARQCSELFLTHPEILVHWQQTYRYILIDEYQDINRPQYEVIRMLVKKHQNLFVVGDDDQSIYGFRGSDPGIMLQFEKAYPNAQKVILSQNYRSTELIVKAAGLVIKENQNRFVKNINAVRAGNIQVQILGFQTKNDMLEQIVTEITKVCAEKSLENCAIIFRTNGEMSDMAEMLSRQKIPYQMKEKSKSIYEIPEIKELLSYCRFVFQGRKRESLLPVLNKPERLLNREFLQEETVSVNRLFQIYREDAIVTRNLLKLEKDLEFLKKLPPFLAVDYIWRGIGYEKYLKNKWENDPDKMKQKENSYLAFREKARAFQTVPEWLSFIDSYRENDKVIWQDRNEKNGKEQNKKGIHLLTMHASKGLEFHTVFLPGIQEGIVPHGRSLSETELEEERRMLYVAMTRAKDFLWIGYETGTKEQPVGPSRFLKPLL
ncbi:MAG: ATP-dependent helicase [Lachnospiraceae bacterium]|nr:ATP-dependent helicase [Lachnospiraceae bacterium]